MSPSLFLPVLVAVLGSVGVFMTGVILNVCSVFRQLLLLPLLGVHLVMLLPPLPLQLARAPLSSFRGVICVS